MKLFRIKNKAISITISYTFTIILAVVIMVILNYILMILFTRSNSSQEEPSKTVKAIALEFSENKENLTASTKEIIDASNLWVLLLNPEGNVIYSRNKPKDIESNYSLVSIAKLSRSFLNDYPVFLWESAENLVILGYPKNSISKYNWSFYSESFPIAFFGLIFFNITITVLLSILLGRRLLNPLNRLIRGIFLLKNEEKISLVEKGIYKDLAHSINETSLSLVEKNNKIKLRDNAIKNWIAGISHDVRTPLSMILGYSAVIDEDSSLPKETRLQAKIITENALRLRELVSNLNLATSLQYDMQPLILSTVRLSNVVREAMASCINGGLLKNCNSEIIVKDESATALLDKKLFERALVNLIINSAKHNKAGCTITVTIPRLINNSDQVLIIVEDNGCGISMDKLNFLKQKDLFNPSLNQRHGLGLFIVKSIITAHHGEMVIESKEGKGTTVVITMPKAN